MEKLIDFVESPFGGGLVKAFAEAFVKISAPVIFVCTVVFIINTLG